MCFPGTWQWEGLQRSLRNVFENSKRKRKNGSSNSATGLLFSRLPAQNVSGVSKQRRHHGPLQLHRKAEREQIPGRTETRGHCVYHHLSSHCGGKCHCFGGNMEEQKIPHTHVLLTGQLDALWFAFRLHLHGEHCDFWCKHSQIDSSAVVSSRRRRVYHTFCVYHQSPRYSHRAARHDGPDEAVSRGQARPNVRFDCCKLGSFGAPRHSPNHGLELHWKSGRMLHRLASLRQELHPLLHYRVHPGADVHRGALRAHLPHCEVQHPAIRLQSSAQRSGQEVPEVSGSAEDSHHRSWGLHRLLVASLCAPSAGLLLPCQSCKVLYKADYFLGIAMINSLLNPIIYTLTSKDMRRAILRLVCSYCLISKDGQVKKFGMPFLDCSTSKVELPSHRLEGLETTVSSGNCTPSTIKSIYPRILKSWGRTMH